MIDKYLDRFPYLQLFIREEQGFYLRKSDTNKTLLKIDLTKSLNLKDGIVICDEDFSKRSYSPIKFDKKNDLLYIYSDEENRENFNIYSINTKTKEFSKVTNCSYCGIYSFSRDMKTLCYGDRYKTEDGKFFTRIYLRDLTSGEEIQVLDDATWKYRLSWSNVAFDESKDNIFILVDLNNNRHKSNIIKHNIPLGETTKLIPEEEETSMIDFFLDEVKNNDFYYFSDLCGYMNLYHINLQSLKTTKLTNFNNEVSSYRLRSNQQTLHIAVSVYEKDESHIFEINLIGNSNFELKSTVLRGAHAIANADELWLSNSSIDHPLIYKKYNFKDSLTKELELPFYIGQKSDLVHGEYKYVEYPSFDGKLVPAYLTIPNRELKGAIITAFYGGENYYNLMDQIYLELGFALLSPAVRGSWTHGKEWRDLIKGDLGGDEIIDLHYGAKFLEKELHLSPNMIGLVGGSHGGYSVLRGLTMPDSFKGRKGSSYPYGFGICWAGFADLEDFYKTSNIPDWLVDMLGPYKGNEKKYKERSPLHDFENLNAPLFISHGANDARVSPTSMEGFLKKIKKSNKDCTIHIMNDLGHSGGNREDDYQMIKKTINFLQKKVLKI